MLPIARIIKKKKKKKKKTKARRAVIQPLLADKYGTCADAARLARLRSENGAQSCECAGLSFIVRSGEEIYTRHGVKVTTTP